MNKAILMGRLTRDPEIRQTTGENSLLVARYTLAVDRRRAADGENKADFISCVAFGKGAEFAEKYLHKGMKICISGRIQTGSYENKEGRKVYTFDIVVEEQQFAESKAASERAAAQPAAQPAYAAASGSSGFMPIPDDLEEDELPFV